MNNELTISVEGSGFLPLQRLERVQAAFLRTVSLMPGKAMSFSRSGIISEPRTTSRHSGLSPAMFPSAHTAWREGEGEREREGEGERGRGRGRE